MSTLTLNINGRDYQIACDDGQEAHLGKLAQDINSRMTIITKHMGRVPDNLHFVLTLLMIGDELSDAKKEAKSAARSLEAAASGDVDAAAAAQLAQLEDTISEQMEGFVERLESLAKKVSVA